MTIGQCGVLARVNIEPDKEISELLLVKLYLCGSHAERWIPAWLMVQFSLDISDLKPELSRLIEDIVEDISRPVKTFL